MKRGKVEMPQLAQSIGMVTSIAAQAGVSLDEMFAVIATASRTIRPAQTMEGLRSALGNIIAAGNIATAFEKQKHGITSQSTLDELRSATGAGDVAVPRLFSSDTGLQGQPW